MPTYDLKCSFCGYEEELMLTITRDLNEMPLGCTENKTHKCAGIMEKLFRTPPNIHPNAIPTRIKSDGVSYKEKSMGPDME